MSLENDLSSGLRPFGQQPGKIKNQAVII